MNEGIGAGATPPRRGPGRPPLTAAARMAAQPQAATEGALKPGAVRGRTAEGRVIVIGRDGKPIHRVGTQADQFAIPDSMRQEGWSYQWIAEVVLNEPQTAALIDFQNNGWTPVPASRCPGVMMPAGETGPIRRKGLMLVERPSVLTEEARAEEIADAKALVRANAEQFMPPDSVASRAGLAPTGRIRKGKPIGTAQDGVAPPVLEIADDDE
jgi:hypothetical protein